MKYILVFVLFLQILQAKDEIKILNFKYIHFENREIQHYLDRRWIVVVCIAGYKFTWATSDDRENTSNQLVQIKDRNNKPIKCK